MSKLAWYINRLKAMGPKEVFLRVREHGLKMTEGGQLDQFKQMKAEELGSVRKFPQLPDRESIHSEMREALWGECEEILAGKWHVLRGHCFHLEGVLSAIQPPKWHKDYLCGKEVPAGAEKKAKDLNHRSLPEGIDPRMVWETSRWIQLVRLAQWCWAESEQAPKKTAEVAAMIVGVLENWVQENPLGYGINWTSPMEPGIRLTNFTWIHALLSGAGLGEEMQARLDDLAAKIVPGHVWWVWRYHSVGTSANNHLLGELCGLMMAMARWSNLEMWAVDFKKIAALMEKELLAQFAEDGGNLEQGLHYHLFAWEMGWQAMRTSPDSFSKELTERMGRAAYFFATVVSPQEPWDFGDSDDAHVTPAFLTEKTCLAEWQEWFKSGNGYLSFWFGKSPWSEAGAVSVGEWIYFPKSGYAVIRKGPLMVRVDGSPLGFGTMAAHGHLDALHVSIWYDGKALIIDPGTGSYFDNRDVRDYFLSAKAHNAPSLADASLYPKHAGPFLWTNHHEDPSWDFVEECPEVSITYGEAQLKRRVEVTDGYVIVRDFVVGYDGDLVTTWTAPPKAERNSDVGISRDGVNLACIVDDVCLEFKKGEIRRDAGHCSEFFRSDDFSLFTQVQSAAVAKGIEQVTIFKLEKTKNED